MNWSDVGDEWWIVLGVQTESGTEAAHIQRLNLNIRLPPR